MPNNTTSFSHTQSPPCSASCLFKRRLIFYKAYLYSDISAIQILRINLPCCFILLFVYYIYHINIYWFIYDLDKPIGISLYIWLKLLECTGYSCPWRFTQQKLIPRNILDFSDEDCLSLWRLKRKPNIQNRENNNRKEAQHKKQEESAFGYYYKTNWFLTARYPTYKTIWI